MRIFAISQKKGNENMKKSVKAVLAAFTALPVILTSNVWAVGNCSDWAESTVNKANQCGILPFCQYYKDFTKPIYRIYLAEIITKAYENATNEAVNYTSGSFWDTTSPVAEAVAALGIMNGTDDGAFSPYNYTTREEIAKIMVSLKAVSEKSDINLTQQTATGFSDDDSISDWAKPYVAYAERTGMISGYEDGTFRPQEEVSWEEAVTLVLKAVNPTEKAAPKITSHTWNEIIPSAEDIEISVDCENDYTLYAYEYDNKYGGAIEEIAKGKKGQSVTITAGTLKSERKYYLYAMSENVFSEPVKVFTDNYSLSVECAGSLRNGYATAKWERVPNSDQLYTVKITEGRNSYYENDIPPKETLSYELLYESSFNFDIKPCRKYIIEVISGDYYATDTFYTGGIQGNGAYEISANYPTTQAEAEALMQTVTVPVWRLKNGKKVSSTASFKVHYAIAERVKLVFEEIYNGPEKFPIKDVGGYNWRGSRSEHNGGTAIDINSNENYCIYNNGTTIGSYWKPYEDPYSITPYGDVINAFEKYGFTWGGDAWRNPKDYMHFSYLGT